MGLTVVTAPAIEPVTLQQAKDHLRVDHTGDDALISELIGSARETAEDITGRAFITRTLDWSLRWFDPAALCRVPAPPLISVASIKYIDTAGVEQTLATALYKVDTISDPGQIEPAYGKTWPAARNEAGAVTVRLVAGYGPGLIHVPRAVVSAMLLIIGDRYRLRENMVVGASVAEISDNAMNLLLRKRDWRV